MSTLIPTNGIHVGGGRLRSNGQYGNYRLILKPAICYARRVELIDPFMSCRDPKFMKIVDTVFELGLQITPAIVPSCTLEEFIYDNQEQLKQLVQHV